MLTVVSVFVLAFFVRRFKRVFMESDSNFKKNFKSVKYRSRNKVSDLNETNVSALRDILETDEFKLEGDLKRLISLNIKRLIDINSVRGRRHLKGLPVRGQRTRTNNRTSRRQSFFTRGK
jgi:ribosomal protein S13